MSRKLSVHLLPALFEPTDLAGGVAVVIDVLRASTTMCRALESGASAVVPVGDVDEARAKAAEFASGRVLLGGERGGERIDGFDLGNSPAEYTPDVVANRTVVFTTTNGTRALLRSSDAERVVVGCFANLNAVLASLIADERNVHLVCAGTNGAITAEDTLFAGALATALRAHTDAVGDAPTLATSLYGDATNRTAFQSILEDSIGGQNLARLGMRGDVELVAHWDTTNVVPVFDPTTGLITAERVDVSEPRFTPP